MKTTGTASAYADLFAYVISAALMAGISPIIKVFGWSAFWTMISVVAFAAVILQRHFMNVLQDLQSQLTIMSMEDAEQCKKLKRVGFVSQDGVEASTEYEELNN